MDDDDRTGEATLCGCGEEDYETKEREQNESRVLGFYSWLVFFNYSIFNGHFFVLPGWVFGERRDRLQRILVLLRPTPSSISSALVPTLWPRGKVRNTCLCPRRHRRRPTLINIADHDLSVNNLFNVEGRSDFILLLTPHLLTVISGKIALVTGGGSGIGEMIATTLVQNGVKVYITSRKEKQLMEVGGSLCRL